MRFRLLMGGLVCLFIASCSYEEGIPSEPLVTEAISVQTKELVTRNVEIKKPFFGQLKFAKSTTYVSELSGRVEMLNIEQGQSVSNGQALVSFPPINHSLQIDQARISFIELKNNYLRQKALYEKGAVSKVALSELKAQLDIQETMLKQLQKVNVITAPFSGLITEVKVKKGEEVLPGSPLFTLADVSQVECLFFVSDRDIDRIAIGGEVSIEGASQAIRGKITQKAVQMDMAKRAFPIKVLFDNPTSVPPMGSTVELSVSMGTLEGAILVPDEAVMEQSGSHFVYLAHDGKAQRTKVSIGQKIGVEVSIKSGIKAGDVLITAGMSKVENNSPIVIIP